VYQDELPFSREYGLLGLDHFAFDSTVSHLAPARSGSSFDPAASKLSPSYRLENQGRSVFTPPSSACSTASSSLSAFPLFSPAAVKPAASPSSSAAGFNNGFQARVNSFHGHGPAGPGSSSSNRAIAASVEVIPPPKQGYDAAVAAGAADTITTNVVAAAQQQSHYVIGRFFNKPTTSNKVYRKSWLPNRRKSWLPNRRKSWLPNRRKSWLPNRRKSWLPNALFLALPFCYAPEDVSYHLLVPIDYR
jgi:hypothetical protein